MVDLLFRLEAFEKRMSAMETRLSALEEQGSQTLPRQRLPRNHQDYLKVKECLDRGFSINGTAKFLKLPYTTVHFYAKATGEMVDKLRNSRRFSGVAQDPGDQAS
jgi:hypothetical protein